MSSKEVTLEELGQHNKENEAWIAIRGVVWNVTDFINIHPGGKANLMRGVGKDGTNLFDQAHPNVKPEKVLAGKDVGMLKIDAKELDKMKAKEKKLKSIWKITPCSKIFMMGIFKNPFRDIFPSTKFWQDEYTLYFQVTAHKKSNLSIDNWCVGILNYKNLLIKFTTEKAPLIWLLNLDLLYKLNDGSFKYSFSKGYSVLSINFKKPTKGQKWKTLGKAIGENNHIIESLSAPDDLYNATIVSKNKLTYNTYHFAIKVDDNALIGVPLGFHLRFKISDIGRSYTPFWTKLLNVKKTVEEDGRTFHFVIKIYPGGLLTEKLEMLKVGEKTNLKIGKCSGDFFGEFFKNTTHVILLAAGSGVTPMSQILKHFYEKYLNNGIATKTVLGYFNRFEKDIILNAAFTKFAQENKWFHFYPVLSKPESDEWTGLKGHVSIELIGEFLEKMEDVKSNLIQPGKEDKNPNAAEIFQFDKPQNKFKKFPKIKFVICGPDGFNSAAVEAIKIIGYNVEESTYVFSGGKAFYTKEDEENEKRLELELCENALNYKRSKESSRKSSASSDNSLSKDFKTSLKKQKKSKEK